MKPVVNACRASSQLLLGLTTIYLSIMTVTRPHLMFWSHTTFTSSSCATFFLSMTINPPTPGSYSHGIHNHHYYTANSQICSKTTLAKCVLHLSVTAKLEWEILLLHSKYPRCRNHTIAKYLSLSQSTETAMLQREISFFIYKNKRPLISWFCLEEQDLVIVLITDEQ